MSPRFLAALGLMLLSLGFPQQLLAYSSPEQVLLEQGFVYPPPTKRHVERKVSDQNKKAQERRQQEYKEAGMFSGQEAKDEKDLSDDPLFEDMEDTEDAGLLEMIQDTLDQLLEEKESTESRRRDRIVERIENQQQEQRLHASASDEPLHSGAPLADTGLGSFVTLGIMLAIGAWILRRKNTRAWKK